MSSELPSQPELLEPSGQPQPAAGASRPEDEAIEALVYEMHPALVRPQPAAVYPYTSRPASHGGPAGEDPFRVRPADVVRPPVAPLFQFDLAEAKVDYVVPPRFGLAAILGMTTALALLFGCMKWLDTEPFWYLFYGFQSIVICVVQMFQGRSPRRASAIAGAILGPLFMLGSAWIAPREDQPAGLVLCFMVMMIPCGAFLGYLNGTCAAGIFLVMDKIEKFLKGSDGTEPPLPSPAVPAP